MSKRTALQQTEFMRNFLAFLLVGAFIGVVPLFVFVAVPDNNKDIIVYMVGQLSGMALTALSFYFVNKVGQDALDAKKSENTGLAFRAVEEALKTGKPSDEQQLEDAVDETAAAAVDKAEELKGKKP